MKKLKRKWTIYKLNLSKASCLRPAKVVTLPVGDIIDLFLFWYLGHNSVNIHIT